MIRNSEDRFSALERRLAWTETLLAAECQEVDELSGSATDAAASWRAGDAAALQSRIEQLIAWLRDTEAKVANGQARLADAERDNQNLRNWLSAAEAREANARARLRDAERIPSNLQTEILTLQAGLPLGTARRMRVPDLPNQADTPVEALLNEYGLFGLSALVKTRRLIEESHDKHGSEDSVEEQDHA